MGEVIVVTLRVNPLSPCDMTRRHADFMAGTTFCVGGERAGRAAALMVDGAALARVA